MAVPIVADATITDSPANDNFGDKPWLEIRKQGHRRIVLSAGAGAIAAAVGPDEVFVSATLEVDIKTATGGIGNAGKTIGLHALTEPFVEAGVTWNCPDDSDTDDNEADCDAGWDMSGPAFDPTALFTNTIHKHDTGTVSFDVSSYAQAVLAGGPDHGWIIKGVDEDEPGHVKLDARESGNGPRLVIVTEAAPPSGDATTSGGDDGATTAASHGGTSMGGDDGGSDTTGGEPPAVVGTVQGRLVDAATGEGISGASVTVGGALVVTDNNGTFVLDGVAAGSGVLVVATSEGFSTASTHIDVLEGETAIIELCAAPTVVDAIPAAEDPFTVVTQDAVQVDVPPAAFEDALGNPVVGEVELETTLLNTPDAMVAAPGDMMADDEGMPAQLESFGMVEFQFTQDGQPVDLVPGTQVQIRIPLSPGHGWAEGEQVGLWTFDEDNGVWLQEGFGTVDGNDFVATVDHFSWWNADQPIESTGCVAGRLLDEGGQPVSGASVTLTGVDYNGQSSDQTTADGTFCVDGLTGGQGQISAFAFDPSLGITLEWSSGNACIDDTQCTAPNTCVGGTCAFALGDQVECSAGGCTDIGDLNATFTAFTCVGGAVPQFVDLNPTPNLPDSVLSWSLNAGGVPVETGDILGETLFDDREVCLSSEIGAPGSADEIEITTSCGTFTFPLTGGPAACGSDDCQVLDLGEAFACEDPGPGGGSTGGSDDGSDSGGPMGTTSGAGSDGGMDGGMDGGGNPSVCDPPDADGDGLSVCQGDCDDANANVYPGAVELCADSTDTDCDGYGDDNPPEEQCVTAISGESCFDFIDIGLGGSVAGDLSLATPDGVPSCWGGGNDLVYRFAVPEGEGREIFFTNAFDDGVVFSLAWDTCEMGPMDCFDGNHQTWLPPGQYFLVASTDGMMPAGAFDFSLVQLDPGTGICTPDLDADGDTYSVCEGDCDDANAARNPGVAEVCGDGIDNDCSGASDDPTGTCSTGLLGACGVGFPVCNGSDVECYQAQPAVDEICDDGVDNDCDGELDAADAGGCTTLATGTSCATPIDLDAQDLRATGTFGNAFDSVADTCGGGQYDQVMRFTVPSNSAGEHEAFFHVLALPGSEMTPMDGAYTLYADQCGVPGSELGCAGFGPGEQFQTPLAAGTYYLVASSYDPNAAWGIQIGLRDPDTGTCAPADADADGTDACDGDCDDANATAFPGNPETCGDATDNDCNGVIDDLSGPCTTTFDGICADGVLVCDGAGTACAPTILPGDRLEVCADGLDNDCDGTVDEDVGPSDCVTVLAGETCDNPIDLGTGGSASGSMAGATFDLPDGGMCWPSSADLVFTFDVPDGGGGQPVDVRFNPEGSMDVGYSLYRNGCGEGLGGEFFGCIDGMEPQFQIFLEPGTYYLIVEDFGGGNGTYDFTLAMFDDMGQCLTTDTDGDGFDPCTGDCAEGDDTVFPGATETCNDIDDDCNGQIDDLGSACATGLPGACADGVQICDGGGATVCQPNVLPIVEICGDGVDNDCDGLTDEDAVADPATPCIVPGGGDTCATAADLGFGGSHSGSLVGTSDAHFGGCGNGSDVFIRFEVPMGPGWITNLNVSGDTSMSVSLLGGPDCGSAIETDCIGIGSHQWSLPEGPHWLVIESEASDPALLDFSVSIASTDDPMGGGGVCTVGDTDGDGLSICEGDCNDDDVDVAPGLPEICDNGLDDNCDGLVDNIAGSCDTGQPGACADGHFECQGGVATCVSDGPQPEICDDLLDSSCDGTDNDGGACATAPAGEHCGNPIDINTDGHIVGDLSMATDDIDGQCYGPGTDTPELLYTFDVPDDGNEYRAQILGFDDEDPMMGMGCLRVGHLYPWQSCDPSNIDCMQGEDLVWGFNYVEPGTHTLILENDPYCGDTTDAFDLQLVLWNVTADQCLLVPNPDGDGDGSSICNQDCDDDDAMRFPGNAEVCDGVDNDCDNQIDEIDTPCATGLDGICNPGHEQCFGSGTSLCVQDALARDEVCGDALDNDCDGVTDEDAVSDPVGDACTDYPLGSCEFPLLVPLDTPVMGDLATSSDDLPECWTCWCDPGPEDVLRFDLPAGPAWYDVSFDFVGSDDGIQVSLFDDSPCLQPEQIGPLECFDAMQGMWQRQLAPGTYYLAVESWDPMGMGSYDLTVSAMAQ